MQSDTATLENNLTVSYEVKHLTHGQDPTPRYSPRRNESLCLQKDLDANVHSNCIHNTDQKQNYRNWKQTSFKKLMNKQIQILVGNKKNCTTDDYKECNNWMTNKTIMLSETSQTNKKTVYWTSAFIWYSTDAKTRDRNQQLPRWAYGARQLGPGGTLRRLKGSMEMVNIFAVAPKTIYLKRTDKILSKGDVKKLNVNKMWITSGTLPGVHGIHFAHWHPATSSSAPGELNSAPSLPASPLPSKQLSPYFFLSPDAELQCSHHLSLLLPRLKAPIIISPAPPSLSHLSLPFHNSLQNSPRLTQSSSHMATVYHSLCFSTVSAVTLLNMVSSTWF